MTSTGSGLSSCIGSACLLFCTGAWRGYCICRCRSRGLIAAGRGIATGASSLHPGAECGRLANEIASSTLVGQCLAHLANAVGPHFFPCFFVPTFSCPFPWPLRRKCAPPWCIELKPCLLYTS